MSLPPRFEDFPLADEDRQQLAEIVRALDDVLGPTLIGAYVHGSAVLGALHPHSDLDVLAVTSRGATADEKDHLIRHLLEISGPYPAAAPPRPIELTVVVGSEVHPWRYPPMRDLQYGEWLRERFERRDPELWRPEEDPDLAVLCTMVLLGDAALVGPPPSSVIDAVPWADVLQTSLTEVPNLIADISTSPRNVVLALARVWSSVVSGHVMTKDAAAEWAIARLPVEHRPVVARARDIYLGTCEEEWDDLLDALPGFADAVVEEIRLAGSTGSMETESRSDGSGPRAVNESRTAMFRSIASVVGGALAVVGTIATYNGYRNEGDHPIWTTLVTVVGLTLIVTARRSRKPPTPPPRPDR